MKLINYVLDLIFPPVCGICGKIEPNYLCKQCENKIKPLSINKRNCYLTKSFNEHFYVFTYYDVIREKIIQYKFKEKSYLYKTFCKIFINNKKVCRLLKKYDIIIPVPIHKKRKKQRGYNQSELVAKELAENSNLQLVTDVLIKNKNIIPQSLLSKEERKSNVIGVYKIQNADKIKNKKILLFDDIYTTGSTVEECSKMLKEAGAKIIGVLTIAKD